MSQPAQEALAEEAIRLGELSSSLGFLLRIAQVKVFGEFFENLAKHGLKPGEFSVLWVIDLNPGLRQGVLAEQLRIKPAHMTKLVQRMVEAGYASRAVPPDDRRSVRLSLTDAGREFVRANRSAFLAFLRAERQSLPETDYRHLVRILRRFTGVGESQ